MLKAQSTMQDEDAALASGSTVDLLSLTALASFNGLCGHGELHLQYRIYTVLLFFCRPCAWLLSLSIRRFTTSSVIH